MMSTEGMHSTFGRCGGDRLVLPADLVTGARCSVTGESSDVMYLVEPGGIPRGYVSGQGGT